METYDQTTKYQELLSFPNEYAHPRKDRFDLFHYRSLLHNCQLTYLLDLLLAFKNVFYS